MILLGYSVADQLYV